jgi:hypothetical protein
MRTARRIGGAGADAAFTTRAELGRRARLTGLPGPLSWRRGRSAIEIERLLQ